jgi:fused signal recognition particle receptor
MFSFFKKKPPAPDPSASDAPAPPEVPDAVEAVEPPAPPEPEKRSWLDRLRGIATPAPEVEVEPAPPETPLAATLIPDPVSWPSKRFEPPPPAPFEQADPVPVLEPEPEPTRRSWMDKLRGGLRKTGSSIAQVFTGTRIDDALYEELESALLMADAGVKATEYLLDDLKWRVNEERAGDPQAVKALLANAITDLLRPLERGLQVGEHVPTVIMVVGVNGAGKTTSIGKLTRHLADANQKVLLAAADTFRAAAREQLAVWAGRNRVEIVGQEGGDPAAVTFDAVVAGKSRGCDVVIADTAGRLTTQTHLMEELKKIRRVIGKAQEGAPHEVLLVVDGNTGQNALAQVQAFDAALQLTGLVITKLDGTAKGGVLAAIALWSRERERAGGSALPVYFIGVGEKLEDLQTFDAREFAQALLS